MDFSNAKENSFECFSRQVRNFCTQYSLGRSFTRILDALRKDVHVHYPFLFADVFLHKASAEQISVVEQLNVAGNMYYLHLIFCDRIADHQSEEEVIQEVLLSNFLHRKALEILCKLYPLDSAFWNYFEMYHKECTCALLRERREHWRMFSAYTECDFVQIAAGKAAIAKPFVTGLALQFEEPDLIEPLSQSQDFFHIAYQLLDDIKDWRRDYEAKQYSFILCKVIESHRLEKEVNSSTRPDADTIGKMLYYSGVAEMALDMCLEYLHKAVLAVEHIPCPTWKFTIQQMSRTCTADKETIAAERVRATTRLGVTFP